MQDPWVQPKKPAPAKGPSRATKARNAHEAQDVGLIEDGAVAVRGDRIVWVGPTKQWDGRASKVIDCKGRLVTPGFVDAHTHLTYAGDRAFEVALKLEGKSYLEILAAGGGIMHTVGLTRQASTQSLVKEALPRLRRMQRAGTTSLEAKSGYGLQTATELRQLEAHPVLSHRTGVNIHSTFLGAHAVPAEFKHRTDEYVDLVAGPMLDAVAHQGIATWCDVFVEEGVFTVEHGERILRAADQKGLKGRLHADEIVNTKGAQLAARCGCATADHLLRVSDSGIEAMAKAGTIATLMPSVPLTLMRPEWPPAQALRDALVPLALGTDHNPNNPVTDMGFVCQLACYALGLSPAQALTAATWNAAASLSAADDVGSLEVGKRADLVLHEVASLDHWVYELGRSTVSTVVCGGRIVT